MLSIGKRKLDILWVDWEDIWPFMDPTIEGLRDRGIAVERLNWYNRKKDVWDFDRVIKRARGKTAAILHFGNIPADEAVACIKRVQREARVKVIVLTIGGQLARHADASISKPFRTSELDEIIRDL